MTAEPINMEVQETQPLSKANNLETTPEPSRDVDWYQPVLHALPSHTIELFIKYVGLFSENDVKSHICELRDKAWDVLPYPCIGVFRFLDFSIHLSHVYPEVVSRVKDGQMLLDLGCCFGQDLRKVTFDAGTSENLIGADIEGRFPELGYKLFRDADHFKAEFITGSIFDAGFPRRQAGQGRYHLSR